MLSINWRATAAYGYAKVIPPADFAWEYLRRHEDYHRDFQTITRVKEPGEVHLEAFSQRLGLAIFRVIQKPYLIANPCSGFQAYNRKRFYCLRCSIVTGRRNL